MRRRELRRTRGASSRTAGVRLRGNSASVSRLRGAACPRVLRKLRAVPRQSMQERRCRGVSAKVTECSRFFLAFATEQLALVVERNQHQGEAQQEERNDAIEFFEERKIEEEH